MAAGERDLVVMNWKEFQIRRDVQTGVYTPESRRFPGVTFGAFPSVAAACKAVEEWYNRTSRPRSANPATATPDHRERMGYFTERVTSG